MAQTFGRFAGLRFGGKIFCVVFVKGKRGLGSLVRGCRGGLAFLAASLMVSRLVGAEASFEALRDETFEEVWRQVADNYYDSSFGGRDWSAIGERYRARLSVQSDRSELRALLTAMLYELGESHVGILSSDYEAAEGSGPWLGGDAGADLRYAGDELAFYRLDENGAAYRAGLRDGDVLLEVNGDSVADFRAASEGSGLPKHLVAFDTLQRVLAVLRGAPGERVKVEARSPFGVRKQVAVELKRYSGRVTQPLGNIGRMPFEFESGSLSGGVVWMRFNLWFPAAMAEIREFIAKLPADTRGLVIDLRGNPGGVGMMAGGLAGLLVDEQTKLGVTTLREGHINFVGFPQRGAFLGPVAVLVDQGSCSTSEVFAIGLQEAGRVRVFGQLTPGAALPSLIVRLPNQDFLQLAFGDFTTPGGVSLEGRGVRPDEIVALSPVELSEGRDTVLEAAGDWIRKTNRTKHE